MTSQRDAPAAVGARHRAGGRGPGTGDVLVRVGAVLFFLGVVAVVAVFVPFLFGHSERGLGLSLAAFLTGLGFALALVGLAVVGRASRRRALADDPDGADPGDAAAGVG